MKTFTLTAGGIVLDSLPASYAPSDALLSLAHQAFVSAFACYLGIINRANLDKILKAGIGYIPVTLAGEYNDGPADEIAQLKYLGIPQGTTVFVDMEGKAAFSAPRIQTIARLNDWADGIIKEGFIPGLYVGSPQPLTSDELWNLKVQRYWRGQGSIRDYNNALAEPTGCGWCMTQMWPSRAIAGTLVDYNMVSADYKSRTPTMVIL